MAIFDQREVAKLEPFYNVSDNAAGHTSPMACQKNVLTLAFSCVDTGCSTRRDRPSVDWPLGERPSACGSIEGQRHGREGPLPRASGL